MSLNLQSIGRIGALFLQGAPPAKLLPARSERHVT